MSFKALFILVPVVSLAVVGCGPSCTGLCDDAKDADCYDNDGSTFDHAGCYAGCQIEEDMEDDDVDECADEFDSLLSCMNDQSDICKAWEIDAADGEYKKCNSEWDDYTKCYGDYCADHTKRDYCGG